MAQNLTKCFRKIISTSLIIIEQPFCPVVVPSSAGSFRPGLSICPGRLSTAWLVSLVVFSYRMVSQHIVHVYCGVIYNHHLCLCDVHLNCNFILVTWPPECASKNYYLVSFNVTAGLFCLFPRCDRADTRFGSWYLQTYHMVWVARIRYGFWPFLRWWLVVLHCGMDLRQFAENKFVHYFCTFSETKLLTRRHNLAFFARSSLSEYKYFKVATPAKTLFVYRKMF